MGSNARSRMKCPGPIRTCVWAALFVCSSVPSLGLPLVLEADTASSSEAAAGPPSRAADADSVRRGLALSQRYRLSSWDGLIVQAALDSGCTTLFTEDLQAGQRFGELEVVNPFADTAHEAVPSWPAPRAARSKARAPIVKRTGKR